ncbi:hypothetical protein [Cochleicola gelatinilyticus]|uniref:Uncharacterized protein n=1 Tax=Cochleicola gelatinilyticus TaxID=1763537 RepID=A0A167KG73_9FLAO|nr:hypothetical protein [Cochleicola gelatinilyticus]OAB81859.1 hypothetical protein ULVI_00560 [Cochleicola gelatinilyticus]
MNLKLGIFLVGLVCFGSCNEIDPKGDKDVKEFVLNWNSKHTSLKAFDLKHEYLDEAIYYGIELTKEKIQQDKVALFERFPDLKQTIPESSISIEKEGGNFLVLFTRTISYNETEGNYPSFLSVIYKNGNFKIVREGLKLEDSTVNPNPLLFPSKATLKETYAKLPKLYGDFNGDALSDYAVVVLPQPNNNELKANTTPCETGCESRIIFSATTLSPIVIKNTFQGVLENVRDLNGDGADEIAFMSETSKTKTLYVYNATTGTLLTDPIFINTEVHRNLKLIDILKKAGPKKIRITESIQENDVWTLKSRVVEVE